jgi:hypothetical protein
MPQAITKAWARLRDPVERLWLKRWYLAGRMKATRLVVRLDLSGASAGVRVEAELSFRPQARSRRMVCLVGDVRLHAASWKDRPVAARCNAPYLVLEFPEKLEPFVETHLKVRYTYRPDQYGTVQQPTTRQDCPERMFLTCRRPLMAVVPGRLVQGSEKPPMRTYEWEPPRCRRLSCVVADVRSFKKETAEGVAVWLHLHQEVAARAPRLLDMLLQLHAESTESFHRSLPYRDFHYFEADQRDVGPYNAGGLIVVPRGTFGIDDRPTLYGILAPELNKEWRRAPDRMVASGKAD